MSLAQVKEFKQELAFIKESMKNSKISRSEAKKLHRQYDNTLKVRFLFLAMPLHTNYCLQRLSEILKFSLETRDTLRELSSQKVNLHKMTF